MGIFTSTVMMNVGERCSASGLCERCITRIDDFQRILFEDLIVNEANMRTRD
jgi:hypothetical protein